jgi:predicted O-methyltransferase YrrM
MMFDRGSYNVLRDLEPDDTATVNLITHNPHARELFDLHPKSSQIQVNDFGYWLSEDDHEQRRLHNLPPPGSNLNLPEKDRDIRFFTSFEDVNSFALLLQQKMEHARDRWFPGYIVVAASAGLSDRDIPRETVIKITRALTDAGFLVVFVGRNYDRWGRKELEPPFGEKVINLIDKLTVPGTAKLLQDASGLVTCHSALNILGWYLRVPQLLLYPDSVYRTHIIHKDPWAFGIDFPETVHAQFEEFSPEHLSRFISITTAPQNSGRKLMKFGICMEGNEETFERLLERRILERGENPFTYLELGIGAGETLAPVARKIQDFRRDSWPAWRVIGVDIPNGWSLNLPAVEQNLGELRSKAEIHLKPSQQFLIEDTIQNGLDFVFIDGCHGRWCAQADFILLHRHLNPGCVVVFHDASPQCQGMHLQPHCNTGIAVREALQTLGLLENKLPGWNFLCETDAPHGIAAFQFAGSFMEISALPVESQSIQLDNEDVNRLTPLHDVRALCWLALQTEGNIVEIGCNEGLTTRDLALTNPDKKIFAVDYIGNHDTMKPEQNGEKPLPDHFCWRAKDLPNVSPLMSKSADLDYASLENVRFVFIDGDHSYEGVRRDTEKALAHLRRTGGLIVWHDVYPEQPLWCGVWQYLNELNAQLAEEESKIVRVDKTWLAYLKVESPGV